VYGPATGHCRIGEAVSGEAGGKMPALARSMLATWVYMEEELSFSINRCIYDPDVVVFTIRLLPG
jgi:hypothetical protein